MASNDTVTTLPDGGLQLNGTKITGDQLALIVGALAQSSALIKLLQGAGKGGDLATYAAALLEADGRGDVPALTLALARVVRHVNARAGMVSVADTAAFTPEIAGLPEALDAGAAVAREFPTQALNAEPDEAALRGQAARIRAFVDLRDLYVGGAAKATANLGAVARDAAPKVQLLARVLEPALSNEDIAARARPIFSYRKATIERGQATKQLLDRQRTEVTGEVTSALYDKARAEARAEVRTKLDDRMAALLDESED